MSSLFIQNLLEILEREFRHKKNNAIHIKEVKWFLFEDNILWMWKILLNHKGTIRIISEFVKSAK